MGNISTVDDPDDGIPRTTEEKIEKTLSRYNEKKRVEAVKKQKEFLKLKHYFVKFRGLIYDMIVFEILNQMMEVNFLPIIPRGPMKLREFYGYFKDDPRRRVYLLFRSFRFVFEKQMPELPRRTLSLEMTNVSFSSTFDLEKNITSRFEELERLEGYKGSLKKLKCLYRLKKLRTWLERLEEVFSEGEGEQHAYNAPPLSHLESLILQGPISERKIKRKNDEQVFAPFPGLRNLKIIQSGEYVANYYYGQKNPDENKQTPRGLKELLSWGVAGQITTLCVQTTDYAGTLTQADIDGLSKISKGESSKLRILTLSGVYITEGVLDLEVDFRDRIAEGRKRDYVLEVRIVDRANFEKCQTFGNKLLHLSNELVKFAIVDETVIL